MNRAEKERIPPCEPLAEVRAATADLGHRREPHEGPALRIETFAIDAGRLHDAYMADELQTCERCGKQVPFGAVGLCPGCRTHYFPGGEVHPRDAIRQPESVVTSRRPGELTLRWRWQNRGGLAAILVVLALGLVTWYFRDTYVLAIGLPITCYWGFAQLFNSTWITVREGGLEVRSGPIPLRFPVQLRADHVRQLYSTKELKMGPSRLDRTSGFQRASTYFAYDLSAVTAPGDRRVKLVTHMPTPDIALFLERELERELGIEDAPVAEELRRA